MAACSFHTANAKDNISIGNATTICGWGYNYYLPSTVKSFEKNYTKIILGYLNDGIKYGDVDFAMQLHDIENKAEVQVSENEINALLQSDDFIQWAGITIKADLTKLISIKKNIIKSDMSNHVFANSDLIKQYGWIEEHLTNELRKKVGLITNDNGIDCD